MRPRELDLTPPTSRADTDVREELRRLRREIRDRDRRLRRAIGELRATLTGDGDGRQVPASRTSGERDDPAAYEEQKARFRALVDRAVPRTADVAVVSRGDDELLELQGRRAMHFPRAPDGGFLGYYPPDGTPVIAHLESIRSLGVGYLAFPPSALWWLESYPHLTRHLEERYEVIERDADEGLVVRLSQVRVRDGSEDGDDGADPIEIIAALLERRESESPHPPSVLDWGSRLELQHRLTGHAVFSPPPGNGATLPYMDRSVDVVILGGSDPARLREARRVAALAVVTGGAQGVEVEELAHAPLPERSVAIIIPTFDGLSHLLPCLRSLEETLPRPFDGSVIVVDDASTDGTSEILGAWSARLPWLRVIRSGRNYGFITSCNRGANAAEEDLLVFLNNDTLPQPGWLPPLIRTFRERPDAGAVGGKLLYPDGRLQEAGGVIFSDGSGANFGRGDYEADGPLYSYTRRVDYCSGALLATPRELFLEVGGFDRRFRPAYYEDTDYCFTLRELGHAVYYQPESAVVHVEGATSGRDARVGVKRYQRLNREKFTRKWSERLQLQPEPPARWDRSTWFALAARGSGR